MTDLKLVVKGENIPMNEFVSNILNDLMMSFLTNLRNVDMDKIDKIEVS